MVAGSAPNPSPSTGREFSFPGAATSRSDWSWALGTALLTWLLTVLAAAPSLHDFEPERLRQMRSGDYLAMCANPLARTLREPILAHRILPPTIAWALGGSVPVSLALPYVATIGMLALVALASARRSGRTVGAMAALLVGSSSAVTWPNCMLGYPDSLAHFLAASLLFFRRPWQVGLICLGGLLCDERFALALPLVGIWHAGGPAFGQFFRWFRESAAALALAVAGWLLVRHALEAGWVGPGLEKPKLYGEIYQGVWDFRPWLTGWGVWWLNVLAAYRWCWLLLLAGFAFRWRAGYRWETAAACSFLAAGTLSTIVVFDVARSVGFTFLVIPLALCWLAQAVSSRLLPWGRSLVWLCYLTPSFLVLTGYFIWCRPLPIRVLAILSGQDPLDWLK